jgi:hypothetical protein
MPSARDWLVGAIREACLPVQAPPAPAPAPPPASAPPAPDAESAILRWLLTHPQKWVARRVESFELLDDRTVRRRMTVDLELPDQVDGHDVAAALSAVPLTVLSKKKLRAFDLRGAEGEALAALPMPDNVRLATGTLVAWAREVLNGEPDPVTSAVLGHLVEAEAAEAEAFLDVYRDAPHLDDAALKDVAELAVAAHGVVALQDASGATAGREIKQLAEHPPFMRLLGELARGFVLLTPLQPGMTSGRNLAKIAYEEGFGDLDRNARWLRLRLGWVASQVDFAIPGASRAASYHAEVLAPADAEILTASARAGDEDRAKDTELNPGGRAHLHISHADPELADPELRVELRARRVGFLHAALVTCVLATALLAGGRARLEQLADHADAAAATLLLVPGLLAAYAVRPGEHAMVTSLLAGVRVMVIGAAACAVAAGGMLLVDLRESTRELAWTWLLLVAATCLVGTVFSNVLPLRPRGESVR